MSYKWSSSPACTELEAVVMDWSAKLFGLADHFLNSSETGGGVIQVRCSNSSATFPFRFAQVDRVGLCARCGRRRSFPLHHSAPRSQAREPCHLHYDTDSFARCQSSVDTGSGVPCSKRHFRGPVRFEGYNAGEGSRRGYREGEAPIRPQ